MSDRIKKLKKEDRRLPKANALPSDGPRRLSVGFIGVRKVRRSSGNSIKSNKSNSSSRSLRNNPFADLVPTTSRSRSRNLDASKSPAKIGVALSKQTLLDHAPHKVPSKDLQTLNILSASTLKASSFEPIPAMTQSQPRESKRVTSEAVSTECAVGRPGQHSFPVDDSSRSHRDLPLTTTEVKRMEQVHSSKLQSSATRISQQQIPREAED